MLQRHAEWQGLTTQLLSCLEDEMRITSCSAIVRIDKHQTTLPFYLSSTQISPVDLSEPIPEMSALIGSGC
jgi:hypothetical protein